MSLVDYLTELRVPFAEYLHAPAFCAQRRAAWLRRPGRYVAKALLLCGPDGFVVAVLPAVDRVNLQALSRMFGGPVRLATRDEVGRTFTDCCWGIVSPFGSRYGLPTLLDSSFESDDRILLEGQTPVEALEVRCGDLERLTGAFRVRLGAPAGG